MVISISNTSTIEYKFVSPTPIMEDTIGYIPMQTTPLNVHNNLGVQLIATNLAGKEILGPLGTKQGIHTNNKKGREEN